IRCRPSMESRLAGRTGSPVPGCATSSPAQDASAEAKTTATAKRKKSVAGWGRALPTRSIVLRKRSVQEGRRGVASVMAFVFGRRWIVGGEPAVPCTHAPAGPHAVHTTRTPQTGQARGPGKACDLSRFRGDGAEASQHAGASPSVGGGVSGTTGRRGR